MSTPSSNRSLALYIGVVQFLFATTWTIYVIYLPQLALQAGIAKKWIPWILVADQAVFAVTDVLVGFWMDRARAAIARFGGWILGATLASGLAFLFLPLAGASAAALLAALLLWAITSAALRSPPWLLLSRHAAGPSVPWLAAIVLAGGAIASALAPYLGLALKGVDARLPFIASTVTLVLTVGGLVLAERKMPPGPALAGEGVMQDRSSAPWFFLALLVLAIGFQVHFALNSAPQYLKLASAQELPWLMPVFWVGFNVLMFPATALAKRLGLPQAMALASAVGALAALASVLAPSLPALIAAQFLAGGCWGAASAAAYSLALAFGRTGREGRYLGGLFAVLALGAFARIAALASQLAAEPGIAALLPWVPQTTWLLGAILLLAVRPSATRREASRTRA